MNFVQLASLCLCAACTNLLYAQRAAQKEVIYEYKHKQHF